MITQVVVLLGTMAIMVVATMMDRPAPLEEDETNWP
jgi:hypothetical protein